MNQIDLYNHLCISLERHDLDGVHRCLHAGAKPHDKGATNLPALHVAAQHGFVQGLEALLQAGADIDLPGLFQYTPLSVAATNNHIDAGRWLIRQGANVEAVDLLGGTALFIALESNHLAFAEMMLEECQSNRSALLQSTAEQVAGTPDKLKEAAWLLEHGISPDFMLNGDRPWLMVAHSMEPIHGDPLIDMLLNAGANINQQSTTGETALHEMVFNGDLARFTKLLRAGASADIANRDGCTVRALLQEDKENELYAAFTAWEASAAAHQIINAKTMRSEIKHL